jgi:hypothetical protein
VLLIGSAAGGILLNTPPPGAPIAPTSPAVAAVKPEPITTFPPQLPADMPQGGWSDLEAEMMQRYLNSHPRSPKPATVRHTRL